MDPSSDFMFKEGNLSSGVYSFEQMRGVTSTTLVDFSCRFTWSVTDFSGKNKDENMQISLHPELNGYVQPQQQYRMPPREAELCQQAQPGFCQPYSHPGISNPVSSPFVSPRLPSYPSAMVNPPTHLRFPSCSYDQSAYPRAILTPKTFSPVLVYQRHPHSFQQDLKQDSFEGYSRGYTLAGESREFTDCRYAQANDNCIGDTGCVNRCRTLVNSHNAFSMAPFPSGNFQLHQNDQPPLKSCIRDGLTTSAFQAWRSNTVNKNQSSTNKLQQQQQQQQQQQPQHPFHIPQQDQETTNHNDSAKRKLFIDTKYCPNDNSEHHFATEQEVQFKPEFTSGLGSEFCLDANFSDPFLDLLHEPLVPINSEETDEKKGRKYKCLYCNVSCTNNGQLKGHLRVHTGEKPFHCDYNDCGRAFARNEELTRHRRIHSGIRPHSCPTCEKRFGRKDHLNKHQKTHLKTAEKKVHVCNVTGCEQRYTRSDALARHQWGAHGIKSKAPKWRMQSRENGYIS